jgi:oligopeptide transport system ATP-binding protein
MKMLLDVQDLHVYFKTSHRIIHAVQGVSFEVYEGETLGIVGESGSGKSALVKALVKLHPSQTIIKGNALLNGRNLISMTEKEMERVRGKEMGMVFQDPMTSLNPTLRIGNQVAEGYLHHYPHVTVKEAYAHAQKMLGMVGISDPEGCAMAYPHTLSGGMRQRAMIALALSSYPMLLLADEPTTALDVTIQAQILDLLKDMQKNLKLTLMLITHDLSIVAATCDRVLVMYAGQIVESGTVYEIFKSPRHPYTQRLLQAIPRLDQPKDRPLVPIEGFPPDLSTPVQGCSFFPRCPSAMPICETKAPPLFDKRSKCWIGEV